MSSPTLEHPDRLELRVARLERRALLAAAVAAIAVVIAGLAATVAAAAFLRDRDGATPAVGPQLIETSEIVLRDERGDLRGRWTVQGLSLADQNGRLRAALNTGPDGTPNVALFGKEGRTRAVLGLGSGDAPALTLHDGLGGVRVRVSVDAEQVPSLTLTNDAGDVVARLPAPPVTAPRRDRSR